MRILVPKTLPCTKLKKKVFVIDHFCKPHIFRTRIEMFIVNARMEGKVVKLEVMYRRGEIEEFFEFHNRMLKKRKECFRVQFI